MTTTNCFVCCEPFNKSTKKKINCPNNSCNFDVCKSCVRQYLLTQKEPHCMNCKQGWNQKFIIEETNKSFFDSEYRKSRKQFLLENEISKLPSTMGAAETYKEVKEEEAKIKLIDVKMREIKKELDKLNSNKSQISANIRSLKSSGTKIEERKKFIMPCPNNDCRGFLSSQYKCEICKLFTCPTCHDIIGYSKNDPHTCNRDSVESAELIKKDTKPCPNCGIRIFKISGCDQMWCTECEQTFSWNTGRILQNVNIHNPHYYNRQREINKGTMLRAPGDILCGGLCSYDQLRRNILVPLEGGLGAAAGRIGLYQQVLDWHRFVSHITNVDLYQIRLKILNLRDNKELRIQYILKEKTKNELADTILRNDTILRKLIEIHNIYELLSVVGIESFAYLCNQQLSSKRVPSQPEVKEIIKNSFDEYITLIKYSNTQLQEISATFSHNVIQINENNFSLTNKKYTFAMLKSIAKDNNDDNNGGNNDDNNEGNNGEPSCSYH